MPSGTVKNWLVESILVLICCCWPLAIPAIIFAVQVNSKLAAGDYQGAVESSNKAKMWVTIAFAAGLAANLLFIVIQAVVVMTQN
jgi:hypothetical protein